MANKDFRILVVDDEESLREVLTIMLHREGYRVDAAADGAQALACLNDKTYDLIISDIKMPRVTGFELLKHVRETAPETVMIMITAFSSTEEAVEAMKQGAYDYITKPFKNEEIRLIVRNALERRALRQESRQTKNEGPQRKAFANLIGQSRPMQELYDLIEKVADTRVNVLITGESGTGKEVVAKAIHYNSDRRDMPFIPINCGAIPENLLESELFGHEKGSFTGAVSQKPGLFEVANLGTLFLDEIGELPPMMQVKLLRVIQEREFRRVGGTKNIRCDVRVIAATNKDLEGEVKIGAFREDLFYRLNVIRIELPSLRERREDIPLLVEYLYHKLTGRQGFQVEEAAMRRLLEYRWPGNIRELENVIERCVVLGASDRVTADCLPLPLQGGVTPAGEAVSTEIPDSGFDLDAYLGSIEQEILQKALEKTGGVRKKAAELLGISFRSIRYRLAKFGISPDDEE
ncbi:two component, sigma54 specific, transcriptional regulator, Fis family [Geoalkalibacter ferrihydriticus]|uniref:Fis family transcriptional regulator n=2 Tax=Geoalkalibacter ferrihydriticus TaxID=392333 RepID=A0A0C2HIN7_9BACT|nr:sigma-54 dependent transcriptional regulator [Geoalkalibacter ferrihydriticus]KIH76911.1 Fis family transcriptional regulator [Geoalkalibacter ferrihydriticus DSM 17813]SDL44835.1 two component, sigma54 specific, transcriptional regulator, Fis family [Geoalkalibacter ferrihydriticus]